MNALTSALIASHKSLDNPTTSEGAKRRMLELKADPMWVRRYFASEEQAVLEFQYLQHVAEHGSGVPFCCLMPVPKSAAQMQFDADRKYDCAIPREVLAAIEEQKARECVR